MNRTRLAWGLSLLAIACITLAITIADFAGFRRSDTLTRILGALDLFAAAVLVYASIKLKIWKKNG